MALTITSEPLSISLAELITGVSEPPVPVSDCWRWCIQPDAADAVTTPGAYATVVVTFIAVPTIPANGTALKIWGYDFTVDNGEPFTGTTFEVTATGFTSALNFISMIQANLFFNDAVVCTYVDAGTVTVTLTWRECREQPRFVAEQMVFTAITAAGGTGAYTNGTSPVYVDGYKIVTRLGLYTGTPISLFEPLSPKVGLSTDQQCTTVGEVCVDYLIDAETMLFTRLPELTSTAIISATENAASMMRFFSIEYGWIYRENCQAKSGTIKKSNLVLGLNAAFDIEDEYQMRRYWYGHPDGYPTGQFVADFLTTQLKKTPLCWESFAWLWMLNSWQQDQGDYDLAARFSLYNSAGAIVETFDVVVNEFGVDGDRFYNPVCFNVSPQFVLDNAPTMTAANLVRYDVTVFGTTPADIGDVLFAATESISFLPSSCCEEKTDLYVLTPAGGFATQLIEIQQRAIVKDGQEINLQVPCGTVEGSDRAKYGGRTMVNLRSYEKIDFTFQLPRTVEAVRWMKHVRQSPQTMLKVFSEGVYSISAGDKGTPIARKFIIDPSTVTTYAVGEALEFKASGYLADIPTQKGTEPTI